MIQLAGRPITAARPVLKAEHSLRCRHERPTLNGMQRNVGLWARRPGTAPRVSGFRLIALTGLVSSSLEGARRHSDREEPRVPPSRLPPIMGV
jgi:hypothetical protein